jgi:flavodoxin
MQTVVIYDSKFGNTERIAEAIARGVGTRSTVRVLSTAEAAADAAIAAGPPDLVLIGGPTHNHGPSAALRAFLTGLPEALRGIRAGSFDTRYRGPVFLMGSAAAGAAKVLATAGAEIVAPPESFFMTRGGSLERQQLEPGEIERAERWGRTVATGLAG